MRLWPWQRKKDMHKDAENALERERCAREDVDSKKMELEAKRYIVNELGSQLGRRREENHFAALIRRSLS